MAWHIRFTKVLYTLYIDAIDAQECRIHLDLWSDWGCQEFSALEAKGSLTGNKWEKHPAVTGSGTPCILGID